MVDLMSEPSKVYKKKISQSGITTEDILQHYGVKGMKWGVRRYQPYPKGEKHKGKFLGDTIDSIKNRKKNLKKSYMDRGIGEDEADKMARRRRRGELIVAGALTIGITAGAIAGYKILGRTFIDKTIKPGSVIQNIAASADRDLSKPFFAAFKKGDMRKYRGTFGGGHLNGLESSVYRNVIKTGKAMKVASHNNARKALDSTVKSNKEFAGLFQKITGTSTVNRKSYQAFNQRLPNLHKIDHDRGTNTVKPFYDMLKKRGYNGLLDINDQKFSGYNANSPAIMFDIGKDAVRSISTLKPAQIVKDSNRDMGVQIVNALYPSSVSVAGLLGLNSVLDVELAAKELDKAG